MNRPLDRFHCILKGYGRLIAYIPTKGWFVKYDNHGFMFMDSSPSQPKGSFHNCRTTGVY